MRKPLLVTIILVLAVCAFSQRTHPVRPTPSGGPLSYEQAAYDVKSYEITARIDPSTKSIEGSNIIEATIVAPTRWIELDLDTPFNVTEVHVWRYDAFEKANYKRDGGKIRIEFEQSRQSGEQVQVLVRYNGKPRVAPSPPWVGGFMWEKTGDGSDWIVVACQNDGADLWFPVKDHPSDEPDSVNLHITVPGDLYVASVGRLNKITRNKDGTKTFNWYMSNPINNYNVVLNIAPYKLIEESYTSVSGDTFPIVFYALPESVEKAVDIVAQTKKFLVFYEKYLGPYPYRGEKLGIAETPHLGMEHSTVIAYGNKFRKDGSGFDWLMLHELGHEWWGNMVTASDWRDMWIHEGFQSYFDSLYLEETKGREAYLESIARKMKASRNKQPVAPRDSKFAHQIYFQAPDYTKSDGDIYGKGAAILHTLRYLIGDDAFFRAVRRMAYPDKDLESVKEGGQNRLVTTDDFKQIAEEESRMDLDWLYEVYLRQPDLPRLKGTLTADGASFEWEVPNNITFPMPLEVEVDGKRTRYETDKGPVTVKWAGAERTKLDPDGSILMSGYEIGGIRGKEVTGQR